MLRFAWINTQRREIAVCGKIQMTFSITQGRRKTPVGQGKTFRIFSPSLLSRQSKVDRRVGEKGHDSWDFLGQTDGARHNRKSKWQFNLTEPTKTKSNANKAPFPLHLTWKCSWVSLSCVHIHTRIWLSYLAYVLCALTESMPLSLPGQMKVTYSWHRLCTT